jgi:26S proteasome regulatory subunit N6
MANPPTLTTAEDLEQANKIAPTDPTKAEELYHRILSHQTSKYGYLSITVSTNVCLLQPVHTDEPADEDALRDQETALVKLGALYRDHK